MNNKINHNHYSILNKIKLYEDLEQEVIKKLRLQFGGEIDDIANQCLSKYGNYLPDKPLEEMIDSTDVGQWLQNKIHTVESRHASFLGKVFKKYKGNAIQIAKLAYEHHGIKCGKDAKKRYELKTARNIYNALNNYILDSMPCDNTSIISKEEKDYLEYKQESCLKDEYWEKVGVDSNVIYDLRRTWSEAFVNSANSEFKYQITIENIRKGRQGYCHRIFKK